ncbi:MULTISPECIES: argininosuccinate synthase [Pyrobaculum]|uniref:Argininosuccinate synthase n=2 Tax=Pyrobaculum arsenaticum TaxID=121277 RepID=A0A7L4P6P6_9CREN|nr:argininosuccinate synthase [Pyrobaculum arsenaticum]MCY0890536.1 argininosuccinate synthase [Pyrobaculum arsenaticum]NYR14522.1 argininosuccinate synthase [Pyrobaculum arsenaticum]
MGASKVVLAYSGGLDTTVAIKWLSEKFGAEVYTVTVDVGQEDDFSKIEERAYKAGAKQHFYIDAKREFAERYIAKAIVMNGMYEGLYPLGTALARPLIVEKVVEVARRVGADAVAHGSTSKGNDQVRFDITAKALAPDLKIIAPARIWGMTRAEEVEYARRHGLPVGEEHKKYSIDDNLWSRSIEGGPLDDPAAEPPEDAFKWTVPPDKAPVEPAYLTIEFERGLPVAVNGEKMDLVSLVSFLNHVGGANAVGRIDHIENRLVGFKSREVYEAPAAVILYHAHRDLEKLVLTPRELRFKHYVLDPQWADLVYQGLWVEPLRTALEKAAEEMEKWVTGEVKVKLYKGALWVVGRESPYGGYSHELADYSRGWYPTDEEARGFIEIWSLHSLTALRRRK